MKAMRRVVWLVAGVLLATFATPGFADGDDEKFKVVISSLTSITGVQSVTATITNVSDDDRIKSFKIYAPSNATLGSAVGSSPLIPAANVSVTPGLNGLVAVKSISLGRNASVVLTMSVTYPTSAACGSTNFDWQAKAWSESNFSDDQFSLDRSSVLRQAWSVNCTMLFNNQPQNAVSGALITNQPYGGTPFTSPAVGSPIQVKLTIGGNNAPDGTSVTLSSTCSLSNAVANTVSGVATFGQLTSAPGSSCKLTAAASGFASVTTPLSFRVSAPSMQFVVQPADALDGAIITSKPYNNPKGEFVKVQLLLDGSSANWPNGFTPKISMSATTCAPLNFSSVVSGNGVAIFSALTGSASPNGGAGCVLTASGFGTPVNSVPFNVTAKTATVACPPQESQYVSTFQSADLAASGSRGSMNKEGTSCTPVSIAFDSTVVGGPNFVRLRWDTASQPNAAFKYDVQWHPIAVDPVTGMPPVTRRTKVAWDVDGSGNPIFVFANACLSQDFPKQYATLQADGGTTLTISAPTGVPATAPFDIVIDNERMTVTAGQTGTSWTVVRAVGGTTQTTHSAGAAVMSTPLPIDRNPFKPDGVTVNPYKDKQAHMCIRYEGFMAFGPGRVQFTTSVFDIGDGFIDGGD